MLPSLLLARRPSMALSPFSLSVVSPENDVACIVSQLRVVIDTMQIRSNKAVNSSICHQFHSFFNAPVDLLTGQSAFH